MRCMSNILEVLSLFVLFVVYLTTPAFRVMLKSWMVVNNEFKGVQNKLQWLNLRYIPDTLKKPTKKQL
jgi:purine-cytosine permease-like protein